MGCARGENTRKSGKNPNKKQPQEKTWNTTRQRQENRDASGKAFVGYRRRSFFFSFLFFSFLASDVLSVHHSVSSNRTDKDTMTTSSDGC